MNLKEELLREHSKRQAERIEFWIGTSVERFSELMLLFLEGDYRISQRAGWPLSNICLKRPELFMPYIEQALRKLSEKNIHDAIIRNVLRVVQDIEIPDHLQGDFVELCLSYISDPKIPGAIKAFSISTLENICKSHPELANEVGIILNERIDYEKPAFVFRAKRFLKTFPQKLR